jgi:hypothetical protein
MNGNMFTRLHQSRLAIRLPKDDKPRTGTAEQMPDTA